jgi:mRNA interferase MazF
MGGISRGDLVTIAIAGDYGKPRPALVVQDDAFGALDSVTVLQLTSDLRDLRLVRINIEPTRENGLLRRSQIQIDKAVSVSRHRIGRRIGRVDEATMRRVDRALMRFLGLQ